AFEDNATILGDAGRKSDAWPRIRDKAAAAARGIALRELGVDVGAIDLMGGQETVDSLLNEYDEAPPADDPSTDLTDEAGNAERTNSGEPSATTSDEEVGDAAAERASDSLTVFEFVVRPGAANPPPEVLIEREQIPHKWVRRSIDLGTVQIDLKKDDFARQA